MVLKKYANRRLYDTGSSKYVTLDEVTERIRGGEDILVVDAATGNDLTQATLTQLILENRGAAKLLPVPLLTQLVRLGDDALAEFFSRWVQWALESYLHGRQSVAWIQQINPLLASALGQNPAGPAPAPPSPFGQWTPTHWGQNAQWPLAAIASLFDRGQPPNPSAPQPPRSPGQPAPQQPPPHPPQHSVLQDELTRLRSQLDELKIGLRGHKRGRKKKGAEGDGGDGT